MVVDLIGIFELKGPYCTLTMIDWFLQALSVIPRGSWGDVARFFTMIRWHAAARAPPLATVLTSRRTICARRTSRACKFRAQIAARIMQVGACCAYTYRKALHACCARWPIPVHAHRALCARLCVHPAPLLYELVAQVAAPRGHTLRTRTCVSCSTGVARMRVAGHHPCGGAWAEMRRRILNSRVFQGLSRADRRVIGRRISGPTPF
ncbi:hypothetical protein F511_43057 [Dorcoceras hygrometricum]|uniref:Uncharacterized protein n=1 Tax=Dorcoceras hygrometricum TaxID=472368 RepID=A0A2Z7A6H7_9LAMI|nr:hypothetical protein F511_43057 [Dorcoceras hygrometricum]